MMSNSTDRNSGDTLLSLIIVVHDSYDDIYKCISTFKKTTSVPSEILVINNGERDICIPEISYCEKINNHGFSHGINRGATRAKSPYILIANPDVVFHSDAVDALMRYIVMHEDIGIIAPRIINPDGSIQASARPFPSPRSFLFGRTSLMTRLFPKNHFSSEFLDKYSAVSSAIDVDWVTGCCMLINKRAFLEIDGFDENYFLFAEDLDFCWRINKTNRWRVVMYPPAIVEHKIGISNARGNKVLIKHRYNSYIRFMDKYYANKSKAIRLLCIIALNIRKLRHQMFAAFLR